MVPRNWSVVSEIFEVAYVGIMASEGEQEKELGLFENVVAEMDDNYVAHEECVMDSYISVIHAADQPDLPPCCDVRPDFEFYEGDSWQFQQCKRSASKTSAERQQIFFQNICCESRH